MKTPEHHTIINIQIESEYYYKHDYLTYCNDTLASILMYADRCKLSTTKIYFASSDQASAFEKISKNEQDWQKWLIDNGFKEQIYSIYYRHTLFSLIVDFCHYMLESINCAAKMKVAVSYALLRKPLKDALGFIEWLYIDRNEIINLLINGTATDLLLEGERPKYISRKIKEMKDEDNYFDFRYEKNADISLERIWNKASHLITKAEYCRTENGTFNFVFDDEDILQEFTRYYYLVVPAIMSYALDLIVPMFEELASLNKYTVLMNYVIRTNRKMVMLGFDNTKDLVSLFEDSNMSVICPRCGKKEVVSKKSITKLMSGNYRCNRCFKSINTTKYVFDWEKIDVVENN
jgi:hypothetical protein